MIGSKAQRLSELGEAGFNVPPFVVLASEEMVKESAMLAEQAHAALRCDRYAVRSAALAEDATTSSMAGQFSTELDVAPNDLAQAIDHVRSDAQGKLGDLHRFSIIIQHYIEPDFAGVTFTRNPSGGRETIVEYHPGRGDDVVSGKITPRSLTYCRTQHEVTSELPNFPLARTLFERIEQLFALPQDIEWCIKDGIWFILQSRPITTLRNEDEATNRYLDAQLPRTPFLFEKTGVTDVAPRPTPITLSLLQKLYADNGPVAQAYRKLGISYQDTDFLVIVGNELFVDRERELRSLLPSYSLLHNPSYRPLPIRLRGFLTGLRNVRRLNKLTGDPENLTAQLKARLQSPMPPVPLQDALQAFLRDYQRIFTINLYAEHALHALSRALPTHIAVAQALRFGVGYHPPSWNPPAGMTGNSLELTDDTPFAWSPPTNYVVAPREAPKATIALAQAFITLREYGRWLAVAHCARIRAAASEYGNAWPFCTLDELLADAVDHLQTKLRESAYETGATLQCPPRLAERPLPRQTGTPLGLSAGIAHGTLVDETRIWHTEGEVILVAHALLPSYAQYFGRIAGIITEHGGHLSHFAILARERGLPVVTNVAVQRLPLGKQATINGTTGSVHIDD